jgi:virginiamycin B lyase
MIQTLGRSRRGWCACMLAAPLAVLVLLFVAARAQAYVYWANAGNGTIGRATLDHSVVNHSFITGATGFPGGVAVEGTHIYWTGNDRIGRANLDGGGAKTDFITVAGKAWGIAVGGAHIYWANAGADTIGRANLDGTGVNQSFITGASTPFGVAVEGTHIYWTNSGNGTIGRADLDGSGVDQSFITGADYPWGVAVDGAHIYWTNSGNDTIGRANLDGTGADQSFIPGARNSNLTGVQLTGVAVDGAHIYWANFVPGTIGRANLTGTGVNQSFIPHVVARFLAVDSLGPVAAAPPSTQLPEPIYFFFNVALPIKMPGMPVQGEVIRPSTIGLFADGSWFLEKLRWTGWGSKVVHATAISNASNGIPSQAQGKRIKTPAQITLSSPGRFFGREVYRCYQLKVRPPATDLHGCLVGLHGYWSLT